MKPSILGVLVLCAVAALAGPASAQISAFRNVSFPSEPRPDVLGPAPIIWRLGLILGMNVNDHTGKFTTVDCQCSFRDAAGRGVLWGAELSHELSEEWGFAVKVLYDDKRGSSVRDTTKNTLVLSSETGQTTNIFLPYERSLELHLAYLVIHPVLQFHPFGGLYVMAGPAIGFTITGTYQMQEKFLDDRFTYLDGTSSKTIEDTRDMPNVESLRIDLRAGLGYNLHLSRTVVFAPEVSIGYPLTKVSGAGSDWMTTTLHFAGVLKFTL